MTLSKQHCYLKIKLSYQKKISIFKKKFHWKNGYKYWEEDATISSWDIYYKDLDEAQKLT